MTKITSIIFDCDGTIVDSEPLHYLSWRHAVQNQGGDLTQTDYLSYVGNSIEANSRLLSQKLSKPCAPQIQADKIAYFHALQLKGIPPIEPTLRFIHHLAQQKHRLNLKLGVASAAGKEELLLHLRNLHIEHLFDIILSGRDDLAAYSDPEGVNKPKPYIYLHAAKLLNTHPSQCIVIEDSSPGVTAGVTAGCFTIAVPNQYTLKQDFSHAHLKLDSLDINIDTFLQQATR